MKRVFASSLLLLAFLSPATATCIVILRSSQRVYVGADSRRVYAEPGQRFAASVCKIVPAGKLLFVASGLTFANAQQAADIGVIAARGKTTTDAALEEFHQRMQAYLPAALYEQARVQVRTGLVLEAAFVGMSRGVPQVSVEWYRNTGDSLRPDIRSDRHTYASIVAGRYDFIFLGKRRAIDEYLSGRYTGIDSDESAQRFIAGMIQLEIRESPETTAPPIDILRLDSFRGLRWLQCKAGCAYSQ